MRRAILQATFVALLGLCVPTGPVKGQVQVAAEGLWEATKQGIEWATKAQETREDVEGLMEDYDNLSGASCAGDLQGMPRVPSMCAEREGCAACFDEAQGRLAFIRGQFERLRCTYQTTRAFANSAIAFGDDVSGVHAVSGLAWQAQRRKIKESLRNFGETYDEQYERGIEALGEALRELAACEAEYGGADDWYDRYGFIYFTFMQDRYRRSSVE